MCRPARAPTVTIMSLVASLVVAGCAACAAAPASPATPADPDAIVDEPWEVLRARPPRLSSSGPAPGEPHELLLPQTPDVVFERAFVPAGELSLLAVVARPRTGPRTSATPVEKLPGLVLCHGGFALASDQLEWAAAAARRGFVVVMPTLRGENGNPGAFELLRGEVEDVRAAVRFLAEEPDVDADRLYALGHSVGGALLALLAVEGDAPLRLVASVNGAYAPSTFSRWRKEDARRVPFFAEDTIEAQVRALVPFAHQVKTPLVLYAGRDDASALAEARAAHARAAVARAPVELMVVDGDHLRALDAALPDFLSRIEKDAGLTGSRPAPAVASASHR